MVIIRTTRRWGLRSDAEETEEGEKAGDEKLNNCQTKGGIEKPGRYDDAVTLGLLTLLHVIERERETEASKTEQNKERASILIER